MKRLRPADGLSLPLDVVTRAACITGQRGTGKTSSAAVLVEEAAAAGAPSVVIDPTDAWWGLRSSADGKQAGLPHIVFGGEHGHLPLREESGAVMARLVVEQRLSAVFSLKHMRKGAQLRFVTEFLEELYHLNREALLVVIDEAHRFAPQQALEKGGYVQRCLGAVIDIATLGRVNGLGIALVTQRLARLHKDVTEACEIMVIHRLLGPNDRKAIEAWLRDAGQEDEAAELGRKLPKLKRGEALVYAPDLDILGQFTIRPKRTFDSSGTPEVGAAKVEPKGVAEVDLSAIEAQIGETIEQAKQDDPKHLRAQLAARDREIHDLERKLADAEPQTVEVERVVEVPVVPTAVHDALANARFTVAALSESLAEASAVAEETQTARPAANDKPRPAPVRAPTAPAASPPRRQVTATSSAPAAQNGHVTLGRAERRILGVLAQFPDGRSQRQLALLTGYSGKSGGFRNALSKLRNAEPAMMVGGGNLMQATPCGLDLIAGDYEPLPQGPALFEHWLGQLGKAERAILLALHEEGELSPEELGAVTGYSHTSGGFRNALSRLRTLELIDRSQPIMLSEDFAEAVL